MSEGVGKRTGNRATLGERLRAAGLLTDVQLQVGLKEQRRTREPLGRILTALGFVREEDLARILFEDLGVQFVSLRDRRPELSLVEGLTIEFLQAHQFVPLSMTPDGVEVAMSNPSDIYAADSIQQAFEQAVVVRGALRGEVLDAIAREAQRRRAAQSREVDANRGEDEDATTIHAVDTLIQTAVELGATDLHLEPEEKLVRVRYRVDGVLEPGENLPVSMTRALITRLKILAGCDITESRTPQDGRISWDGPYGRIELRVSILPCVQGETVVCRLLDHSGGTPRLDRLGLPARVIAELHRAAHSPSGIFYVTGPTGSGKTTTLYSMLATLDPMERNICTVEDPVEYRMPLVRQCQVQPEVGLDFAAALRSLLRQDPDVILIGETRDLETAQIAVRASLTGHFVLSTLHTTTALGAVTRLADMGVEPYLLSSTLSGVLGQRLVRTLCAKCRVERPIQPAERELFARHRSSVPQRVHDATGCVDCGQRGYQGRVGVFEYLPVREAVRSAIARRSSPSELRSVCLQNGYLTMVEHALELVIAGVTSAAEVFRVIPEAVAESSEQALDRVVEASSLGT